MNRDGWLRLAVGTLVLLFFLQALRVLFSMVFGILYDQIFAGSPTAWLPISLALVVGCMLAPLAAPGRSGRLLPGAAAIVAALARIPLTVNDAEVRFWAALLIVASAGVFFACLHQQDRGRAWPAWVMALAVDQLLRIAGQTYDLSLQPSAMPYQVLLSVAVAAGAAASSWGPVTEAPTRQRSPAWMPLSFGGLLFLETSLLSVANATARWSWSGYEIVAPLTLAVTLLVLHPAVLRRLSGDRLRPFAPFLILPIGLMVGRSLGGLSVAGLLAAHGLALVAWRRWSQGLPPAGRAGGAVGWGMAIFLLLNFLSAFTFTYPYTLPFLRGLGWGVYLIAGFAAALPLAVRRSEAEAEPERAPIPAIVAGASAVLIAVFLAWPAPIHTDLDVRAVRIATYNIHYGFDERWGFNLDAQAEAIRHAGVDVIALQEVDTGRMTSFMADDAYYLARKLGMQVAYLPAVESLTGIAVLSHGEREYIERLYLPSLQEQTGIVHVALDTTAGDLHIFGVWMGLSDEDTLAQIREALAFIADRYPAAFGGDFNAEPASPVYQAVVRGGFLDPFLALGLDSPPTSPAVEPKERIDFVFLRGLAPRQAFVSESTASDHRMVVVEVDMTAPPLPGLARRR
jgi:endonuclease/exonuclease/phosphatase family metal-dependent hydrolase